VTRAPGPRGGVLVIRLWVEDGFPRELRARITSSADMLDLNTTTVSASGVDSICARVRAWLEEIDEKVD
jgi:hypothetical protein